MNNFLEIQTIHDKIVLISVEEIEVIREGISVNHNFIQLKQGGEYHTYESIEEIKEKLK
jgi:competence protein ComGF